MRPFIYFQIFVECQQYMSTGKITVMMTDMFLPSWTLYSNEGDKTSGQRNK